MASSTTQRCSLRTLPQMWKFLASAKEITDVCNVRDAPRIVWLMSSAQGVWREWTCVSHQVVAGWEQEVKRHQKYKQRNLEACSSNYCCSRKTISIVRSECVFVAFVTNHTKRMFYIVIFVLSGSTIFFHIISKRHDFRKKKKVTEH